MMANQYAQLAKMNDPDIFAAAQEDDMHTCWFCMRGPDDSPFENGWYIGSITMPKEYPMKAPVFRYFTPSSRFQPGKSICTTFSQWHPESWTPSWSLKQQLHGLRSFMLDKRRTEIGAMQCSDAAIRRDAAASLAWNRRHPRWQSLLGEEVEQRVADRAAKAAATAAAEKKRERDDTEECDEATPPPAKRARRGKEEADPPQ